MFCAENKYLDELKSGDSISIMNAADGNLERSAVIGRLKIERRPFLKIVYQSADGQYQGHTFLQQASSTYQKWKFFYFM